MRSKSPELMNQICKYVEKYHLQNGHSPSTSMIGKAVGIARGTAYKYLVEMSNRGMIEYDGQEIEEGTTAPMPKFEAAVDIVKKEKAESAPIIEESIIQKEEDPQEPSSDENAVLLAKLLSNPETAALLKALAKNM